MVDRINAVCDVKFCGGVAHELGIAFANCLDISLTRVGSVSD
jgi:hypothetical protein